MASPKLFPQSPYTVTILHLLSQLEVTGAETYVESLVGELPKRGHRFLVGSDTGPWDYCKDPFEIRRIGIFPGLTQAGFMRKISGYYHRYRRIIGR
jgi:hypothetical protein